MPLLTGITAESCPLAQLELDLARANPRHVVQVVHESADVLCLPFDNLEGWSRLGLSLLMSRGTFMAFTTPASVHFTILLAARQQSSELLLYPSVVGRADS